MMMLFKKKRKKKSLISVICPPLLILRAIEHCYRELLIPSSHVVQFKRLIFIRTEKEPQSGAVKSIVTECYWIAHCVILSVAALQRQVAVEVRHRWGEMRSKEGQPDRREGHLYRVGKKFGGLGCRNKQACVHSVHMTTV